MRPFSFLVSLLIASTAVAQVSARQGSVSDAAAQREQRFKSPMVLELPFPGSDISKWGSGHVRGENIGPFVCEGVSFRDFAVAVERVRGKKAKITYYCVLTNEPGVDKLAMIRFALHRGDTVLSQTAIPWFQVEEGRISVRSVTTVVPSEMLTSGEPPQLRITLSTQNDD
jgi:hypothetical protein